MVNYKSEKGLVTNIQRFSVDDGPGIRTTIFLKGCTLACRWCHNPETIFPDKQLQCNAGQCKNCFQCIDVCPTGAHRKEHNIHIFDRRFCNNCFKCCQACVYGSMQTIGNEMDVMEVCNHVMKDYKFYAGSGGGVTLSGGEPLLQFQFSESILKNLKNNKVHTAVDTAANTPWENFEAIIPYTDLFLVDIKMANKKRHYDHTGDGNERIIKNFNKLWQKAIPVWVRIPLIFGINDLDDEIDQMIELIRNADNVRKIQLLPYHRYGLGKYEMLGIRKEGHEFKTPSDEKVKGILDLFHNAGLTHAECG